MADTDTPETSYGQQQDAKLEFTTAKGDIRDLYAYYRLSDHEMTNIALKNKVHQRVPVWFEGHMNWTFKKCTFKEAFYFGVEGDKLEEDTRGTDLNPEPYPPYGHNGLNFSNCSLGKSFEIQNNCNVVFYDCSFESVDDEELVVTIGDSCRVEFINCSFKCALTFDEYCDVNFRNCSFEESESHFIKATNHCKIVVDKCDLSQAPEGIFFDIENDCSLSIYACDSIASEADLFHIVGQSHLKLTDISSITSDARCFVVTDSKIEALGVTSMVSGDEKLIECSGSEVFIRGTTSMSAMQEIIQGDNSLIRLSDISDISSSQNNCFDLADSKIYCSHLPRVFAYRVCFLGEDTFVELTDATNLLGRDGIFHLSGLGVANIRSVDSMTSELGDAISLSGGYKLFLDGTDVLAAPQGKALVGQEAEFQLKNVNQITSRLGAVSAEDSFFLLYDVGDITADVGSPCIQVQGGSYDIKNISSITGASGGVLANSSKGVLDTVEEIVSSNGVAVEVNNCSGPTEWSGIGLISSDADTAFVVTGDVNKFRVSGVGAIISSGGAGVSWTQTTGTASIYAISTISAGDGTAAEFDLSDDSELYLSLIGDILATTDSALKLTTSGYSKARFKDLGGLESQEGIPLLIEASQQSDIAIWGVTGEITTIEEDACVVGAQNEAVVVLKEFSGASSVEGQTLVISAENSASITAKELGNLSSQGEGNTVVLFVDEEAGIKLQSITDIDSEVGVAVSGEVNGSLILDDVANIRTVEGQAVSISGSGVKSNVKMTRISSISGDEPSDSLVSVVDIYDILLQDIGEITVQTSAAYILFLRGASADLGAINVIDVLDINGKCRGGVYLRQAGEVNFYNTNNEGQITCEEGVTYCVLMAYIGKVLLKNFSKVENTDGSLGAVYGYLVDDITLENIPSIQGKQAINYYGGSKQYLFIDCGELKAPESGQTAVSIAGSAVVDFRGGTGTTIEAKDENTQALVITGTDTVPEARIYKVDISPSKGRATFNNILLDVHKSTLNGSTTISNCAGKIIESDFTCGLNITSSDLRVIKSPISLGSNSGPDKNLTVSDSIIHFIFPEISGSENVDISSSVIEFSHASNSLTGSEDAWAISDTIFRGDKVSWAKDLSFSSQSVVQVTKVDIENNDITLDGPDQVIEGHHVSIGALTLGEDNSGFLSHAVLNDTLTVQARSAFLQLGKSYANNISFGNDSAGALLGLSTTLSGTLSTGDDVSLALLGLDGDDTALDIGASSSVIANRITPGEVSLAQDVAFLANGLEHDGNFTTVDDAAVLLNNYQQNTGKLTLGARSAGVFIEAFSQQTEIQQSSGAIILGCDLRQVAIGLDVGILAADWECNNGNISTGSNTAIIGARMRLPGQWQLGLNNGFISACGSGSWNSSSNGIGAILARHDQNLTIGGSDIGVVGVSLDNDITLSSADTGLVLAGGRGTYSGMGAVVGADVATVEDALTAIISLGSAITADDLVGVGITTINSHDAGVVVGSGGTWAAAEGTVIVGGSCGAVSTAANGGLLSVGGTISSLTGVRESGIEVVATTVSGAISVGPNGGVTRTGGGDSSTISGGSQAGILTSGGKLSTLTVPLGGGVIKSSTIQSGSTGWDNTGGVISAGLPQTAVPDGAGGVFAMFGGSSITSDGAAIVAGGYAGGVGTAIAATSEQDYLPPNTGAALTGVIACLKTAQIYNNGGTTVSAQGDGLVTATGGDGTGVYLGYDLFNAGGGYTLDYQKQSRAAREAIYDYSPEIHHNYYYFIEY